uniref:Uncharacterized protein n=1 Tax=Arundo donax TaxID=35708 RepID=A0A0A8ZM25_ARUDO
MSTHILPLSLSIYQLHKCLIIPSSNKKRFPHRVVTCPT